MKNTLVEIKKRIIQIIPTENCVAIFGDDDNDEDNEVKDVTCFALVQYNECYKTGNIKYYNVEPMIYDDECGSVLCEEMPDFKGIRNINKE